MVSESVVERVRDYPGVRALGQPNSFTRQFDFWDDRFEARRLFSELLGTFLLVLVAVGGGMVNARFGGNAVPYSARVVAPGLMVAAIILFMGAVGGAHLNPAVSMAFAARGNFPWKRVPAYVLAQLLGAILATLLLWALIGKQGVAGLTLPGQGISTATAMVWELMLSVGPGEHHPGNRCQVLSSSVRWRRSGWAATSPWPACGAPL